MNATNPVGGASAGSRMQTLAEEIFPICRSITGDGVRETLRRVGERIPLEVHEVPSGSQVLDWTVPDEWNIDDAYVATEDGRRVIDFQSSNLHVVSYSEPIRTRMTLEELRPRLHVHSAHREWIPYRTSYYDRTWGFCLSKEQLDEMGEGTYEVVIDSTLAPGSLTYGECVLPGDEESEVLVTTHVCHPSLANDNVSGIVALTELAVGLLEEKRRFTYRFLFLPGTIGAIAWLARNEERLESIVAGLVLACAGDRGPLTYKRSRHGNRLIDSAGSHVVGQRGGRIVDFVPWGWDERQFNSPGFDLPVGCLSRSREGEFTEYHSSADNLELISAEQLEDSYQAALDVFDVLEHDAIYINQIPKGEPQLGRRGLYRAVGGGNVEVDQLAILWVLNQSDGTNSLLDIAERSGLAFSDIRRATERLVESGVLQLAG